MGNRSIAIVWLMLFGCGGGGGNTPDAGRSPDAEVPPDAEVATAVEIMPANPTLTTFLGSPTALTFTCLRRATGEVVAATWSVSDDTHGAIDTVGAFTAADLGGTVDVTCSDGADSATTTLKVYVVALDDNGVSPADQVTLMEGELGVPDGNWMIPYPYDETVFPLGIVPPAVHYSAGAGGTVQYLHITTEYFEYRGFFPMAGAGQLRMSPEAWAALGASAAGQRIELRMSKLAGATVYGPRTLHVTIADGELHGAIYYNSYDSPLAGNNGAVLRIRGGSTAPEVVLGNCTTCHSVAADGTTIATANHSGGGGVWDLAGPAAVWGTSEEAAYAAVYPKGGEVIVQQGAPGGSWPPNTPGTNGPWTSSLRQRNGTVLPSSGIESHYAMSPAFSLDGTHLAFNDRSNTQVGGYWPGVLAMMDYDHANHTFSNYQVLATPPGGRQYSWPVFTPDGASLLFQDGVGEDLLTWSGNTGSLRAIDPVSHALTQLTALGATGYAPAGARDWNKDYEPSFMPVASGGYYWVVFTSRRTYGNVLTGNVDQTKRLWIAAYDPNAPAGTDPTHPAFYVDAQELTSGNHRGQWALDPPAADGQICRFGDQCASGFCDGTCVADDGSCAEEFERCDAPSDCCDANDVCINGYCGRTAP